MRRHVPVRDWEEVLKEERERVVRVKDGREGRRTSQVMTRITPKITARQIMVAKKARKKEREAKERGGGGL